MRGGWGVPPAGSPGRNPRAKNGAGKGSVLNGAALSNGFGLKVERLKVESPNRSALPIGRKRLRKGTFDMGPSDLRPAPSPSLLPA